MALCFTEKLAVSIKSLAFISTGCPSFQELIYHFWRLHLKAWTYEKRSNKRESIKWGENNLLIVSYASITVRECPDQWLSPWSVDPVITHTLVVAVWRSVLFQWILSLWVMICHAILSSHATWLLMPRQCNQPTTWCQSNRATCPLGVSFLFQFLGSHPLLLVLCWLSCPGRPSLT